MCHSSRGVTLEKIDIINYNLPGIIVSVADSGHKINHYSAGVSDVENDTPFSPDHIFQNGRITRTFTAALVLKLVEKGVLDLDMPIDILADEYVLDGGRLRLIVNQYPYLKPITLRELLNHTSGIPSYDQTIQYQHMLFKNPRKVWQMEEYLDLITGKEVRYLLGNYLF